MKKQEGLREGVYFKLSLWVPLQVFQSSKFVGSLQAHWLRFCSNFKHAGFVPLQFQACWLCSCSCSNDGSAPALTTPELWRWSEHKIRWEVGRREIFWGREEAEKTNNLRHGGCVFGSSPKWLQLLHPQLVYP
jgi:hypothetical protein